MTPVLESRLLQPHYHKAQRPHTAGHSFLLLHFDEDWNAKGHQGCSCALFLLLVDLFKKLGRGGEGGRKGGRKEEERKRKKEEEEEKRRRGGSFHFFT